MTRLFPRFVIAASLLAGLELSGLSATHAAPVGVTSSISAGSAPGDSESLRPVSADMSFATVPYWTIQYSGRTLYFVGSDPARSHAPTTIATEIIPLRVVFSDGSVLDSATEAAQTVVSPIFSSLSYATGTAQYGNAILRASFWSRVKGTNWGTVLGRPKFVAPVTLHVPANEGFRAPAGTVQGGFLNYSWFSSVVQSTLRALHLDPHSLPIVLGNDLVMYCGGDPTRLCSLGFHYGMAVAHGLQTYIYATWVQPGAPVQVSDVMPLGHEVSEWLHDPFINNIVDPWPLPQGGCSELLETGDPLVSEDGRSAIGNPVTVRVGALTFHLQNEALVPYFTRQTPSTAFDEAYSFPDTAALTAPAPKCL